MDHSAAAGMAAGAAIAAGRELDLGGPEMSSLYRVECIGADGVLKWVEEARNIVTNVGLNDLLDKYLKGSGYTAAWFVGLKGAGAPAAADTLASHAAWSELTGYTGNRKALTLGTVASQAVDNTAAPAAFAVNASATVAGAFVCAAATGTAAILYGVANFGAARAVESGDTLNVTVTATAASA